MSHVHNFLILPSLLDEDALDEFNAHGDVGFCFKAIDVHAGGTKGLESPVWAMATNYNPNRDEVVQAIATFPWRKVEELTLFHKGPDDNEWTMLSPEVT